MQFTITLDRNEDGVWITECPSISGCVSQGQTRELPEALYDPLFVQPELRLKSLFWRTNNRTAQKRSANPRRTALSSG